MCYVSLLQDRFPHQLTFRILHFNLFISIIASFYIIWFLCPHRLARLSYWYYFERFRQRAVWRWIWQVILIFRTLILIGLGLELGHAIILQFNIREPLIHRIWDWLLFFARRSIFWLLVYYKFRNRFLKLRYIILRATSIKKYYRLARLPLELRIILLMPHMLQLLQLIFFLEMVLLLLLILGTQWFLFLLLDTARQLVNRGTLPMLSIRLITPWHVLYLLRGPWRLMLSRH